MIQLLKLYLHLQVLNHNLLIWMAIMMTLFIIGAILIIIEMLTNSFYLLVIGLGFVLASLTADLIRFLSEYQIGIVPMLLLSVVYMTIVFFVINKFYPSWRNKSKFNDGFLGIGDKVMIVDIQDFLPNENLYNVNVLYKGVNWSGQIKLEEQDYKKLVQYMHEHDTGVGEIIGNDGNILHLKLSI